VSGKRKASKGTGDKKWTSDATFGCAMQVGGFFGVAVGLIGGLICEVLC